MKRPGRALPYVLKYGITTLIGGLMAWAVIRLHGLEDAASQADRFRILTDAFTVPGVVLILVGVLVWISNQGAFDGLSFVGKRLVHSLLPFLFTNKNGKIETYYDYVSRKKAAGGIRGYAFLFIVGGVFFAASLVFLFLYERAAH